MKKYLFFIFLFSLPVLRLFATGEPSTYFNIYVPPNNEVMNRDVCLIVTALYDSTTFSIADDGMDGDTDDSKTGMLMSGQSYILFVRNNGVNDDAPHSGEGTTKNDGDYFTITSNKLVFASQATLSGWQHDWLASFNKTSKGEKFIVYSNGTNGSSKNDINVFAYEDSTMVVVKKISSAPQLQQGYTNVNIDNGKIVMQKMIHVGKDLINFYTEGRDLLADGETYIIQSNKPVTVQYGALYGGNERDGGGYVPSANGSSAGELFYFAVPYQAANEQEIRIVSWNDNNNVVLDRYVNGSWVNVRNFTGVNALKAVDWVGATDGKTYANVFRITCSPGKKVSVLEANWMETGSPGTSDMATMASSDKGTCSGNKFLVYMPPPGNQGRITDPFTGLKLSQNTHAYVYAKNNCTVTVTDAYTNGAKLSRQYNILAGRYADVNLTLSQWKAIYNGTGTTAGGAARPYLLITSTDDISVMVANTNDNWMMYFGSSLEQGILQSNTDSRSKARPGDTVSVVSTINIPGGSMVTAPVIDIKVSEGAEVVKCRFKDVSGNTAVNGTPVVKKGCGTKVRIDNLASLDSSHVYKVETDIVMQPIGSDAKLVANNDLIMVDMTVSGTVNGNYQQSSSSSGVVNEALNTSNYAFSKITSGSIATDTINSWNANWVDLDNDNYIDLFVPNYTKAGKNIVYINNKSGGFIKSSTYGSLMAAKSLSIVSSAFADMNNDGTLCGVLGANLGQESEMHSRDTGGVFGETVVQGISYDKGYAQTVNITDYDRDGKADVFISEYFPTSFCRLYHNEGNNVYSRVTEGEIAQVSNYTTGSTWCDYDNDGYPDLFIPVSGTVANPLSKKNLLFHNDGNGKFTKVTQGAIVNDEGNSTASCWGDYDNDGFMDLFVSNASNQLNCLYHNDLGGNFTKITTAAPTTIRGDWHGCAWVDYDNDGFLDLYVISNDTAEGAKLYHNDGGGVFTLMVNEIICGAYKNAISQAWADYDKDGFQDLYMTTTGGIANHLFHNNGNANQWINILLKGTRSNKSALGAAIYVKATIGGNSVWQKREVTATSGFGAQSAINACFGLGNATVVDTVIIKWPSGIVQYLANVQPGRFLQVDEPVGGIVTGNVFFDANANCVKDAGEKGIKNIKLKVMPGDTYLNTDSLGNFSAVLPVGTYTLTQTASSYWQPACTTAHGFTVNTAGIVNANVSAPTVASMQGVDLYVNCGASTFRKGFKNQLVLNYGNHGNQAFSNTQVTLTVPQGIYLTSSVPQWTSVSGNTYTWNIGLSDVATDNVILITDSVGHSYKKGDAFTIVSTIGNCSFDVNIGDNQHSLPCVIIGAVDPNDIVVSPEGEGEEGYIPRKQSLTYTVNFENIGDYMAENVTISCALPEPLEPSMFDVVSASHSCHYQLTGRNLKIMFDNIGLPFKKEDPDGAKGYVTFELAQKNSLLPETRILNGADIVFDYEEPINTGSVRNTIYPDVTVDKSNPLFIYPNPLVTGVANIRAKQNMADIKLRDIAIYTAEGNCLYAKDNIDGRVVNISRDEFPAQGIYIIRCHDDGERQYTGVLMIK